ncbi:hypothetical protein JKP88DRAFT_308229 [Tribonema minus]|uniref:Myb-like domain-containing protein n=1 Tax=Tribonema minus TaxID=303371 RepID=A0A836CIA1_9STRA|nr:hypothetical protein JKP88DRAFT_308229 [Tribonema minus]
MVSTRTRTPPPVQANGEVTLAAVKDKFQPPATHTARVQVLRQARAPTAARASPAPAKAMPTPHLKTAAAAKPAPPVTRAVRARPIDVDRKLLVIKPGDMRTLARFLENDPQGVDNMAELLQDLCKEDSIYNRQPDLEDEEDHQASGDADGGGGGKATSAAAARSAVEVPGFRLVNDGGAAGGSAGGSEEAGEAGRGKGKGGKRRAVKAMRFEQDDIPQLSYSGYDCDSEDEAFILRANASYRAALAATAKPTAKGGGKKRVSLRRGVQPPIPGAASQGLCAADTSNPLTTSIMEQMLASLEKENFTVAQLYLDVITPERAQQLLLPHISGAFHSGQGGGGSCNSAVTELVSQVYQYWVAKRRALLGPLLRCYDHFPLLENWQRVGHSAFTPCNWSAAAIGPAVSEPANETTAAAAVAGTEAGGGEQRVLRNEEGGGGEQQELTAEVQERLRVYRDMRRLRQELDRVRLVADLARRREKLKRDRCRTSAAWWTALITAAGECDAQDTLRRIASIVAAAPQTDRQFACGGVEPNAPLQQQQQQQRQPKQEKAEPVPVTKPQPQQQSHKRAPAAPPPPQQSRKRAAAPLPREPPPKLPEGCTEAQAVKLLKGTNWEVEWRRGGSGGRHMAVVRKNSAPAAAVQPQPTHHRRAPVSMKAFNMWTPEEDALLLRGVAAHGHGHWADVRESTGLQRNSAQMNQRFARLLRNSNLEAQKALMARPPRSVDSSIARHMTGSSANGAGSSSGTSKKSRNGDSGGAGDKSSDGGGGSRKRKGGSGGAAEQGSSNSSSSGADAGSARAKVPKIGNTSAGSPVRKGSVVARGASVTNAGGSTRASKHASGSDSRAPSTGNAASARKPAIRKGGDGTGVSGSRSGSKGGTGPAGALRNSNSADSRAALRRADALARRAGKGRRRV